MILIDSNILMYAAGGPHPLKQRAITFLARIASGDLEATIDVEVLQEIFHRYRALRRWEQGKQVFDQARILFPNPLPVTVDVMDRARKLLDRHANLTARDAVHGAVVLVNEIEALCSFDRDFDGVTGLHRIEP